MPKLKLNALSPFSDLVTKYSENGRLRGRNPFEHERNNADG